MSDEDNILIRLKYNYVKNIKHYVNARTLIVEVESKYYRTDIFTNDDKTILNELQKMSGQKVKICFIEYEYGLQIVKKRHSTQHDVWVESKYGWCLSIALMICCFITMLLMIVLSWILNGKNKCPKY